MRYDLLAVIFDDDDEPIERRILRRVEHANRLLKELLMGQAEIDAAVTALQDTENGLDATATRIEQKIADLEAQNPGVDTSALTAEVANLRTHADAVAAIAPEPAPE